MLSTSKSFMAALLIAMALQALPVAAAVIPTYGLDGNGSYEANLLRVVGSEGLITFVENGDLGSGVTGGVISRSTDGGYDKIQWGGTPSPTAYGTVRYTLDKSYTVNQFYARLDNDAIFRPESYSLRVSNTGFDSMTTVVDDVAVSTATLNPVFTPTTARYIEYQWTGLKDRPSSTVDAVMLREAQLFAHSSNGALTDSGDFNIAGAGLNVLTANNLTPTINDISSGSGGWNTFDTLSNALSASIERNFMRGNGSGDDAVAEIDLSDDVYGIGAIQLAFFDDNRWSSGGKVEVRSSTGSYQTVLDTTSSLSTTEILFGRQDVRYVRITNYDSNGGALSRINIHSVAVPEPGTTALILFGTAILLWFRRFRQVG